MREANSGAGLGDAVLPSSAYSSREFLGLEQRSLFARRWLCVGLIDDVAEPGDVIPLSVAGRALLVSRDWDGEIHVFHNFCRHRGMSLVERPCSALKTLVCPYHSWVYGLDGRLLRTPHIGGFGQHDRDSAIPGLQRVRSAVWHRLLFINLSDDAPAFAEYIEPLAERWAAYDLSLLRRGESARYQIQSNWKLPIENFIDYYHLPSVHPGLNSYSAMEDHYQVENDTYFGQGNQNNRPTDDSAGILPEFPGLNPRQSTVTEAFCLFPNLLITIFNDSLRIILVEPAGPECCTERVEVFFVGDEAMAPKFADARRGIMERFIEFNDQDRTIIEGLQRCRGHSEFDGGRFLPDYDRNVARYHRLILEGVSGD